MNEYIQEKLDSNGHESNAMGDQKSDEKLYDTKEEHFASHRFKSTFSIGTEKRKGVSVPPISFGTMVKLLKNCGRNNRDCYVRLDLFS